VKWEQIVASAAPAYGVCDFGELSDHLIACRAMARVPKEAKSVIVCLFPYRFREDETRELSYYACVPDYHLAAGAVLEQLADNLQAAYPENAFVPFTDNSPIPEVYAAARAGLGMIGDHRLLIHPTFGSYVFIGEIVTDLQLPAANADVCYCEHCGACSAACPGNCLPGDNRDTCVSAVSQKKGELTAAEAALLKAGGLVWGCDRCQEACPHNLSASTAPHPCFTDYTPALLPPDHPQFSTRAYAWRGKTVPYRNQELLK
jgi:epoxyqueuosine reductase QueG